MNKKPLKIAFLSGPANAPEIYREWQKGSAQEYFGTDYLKQFLQVSHDMNAESVVITWYKDKKSTLNVDGFTFVNRPITNRSGLGYYVAQLWWHITLLPRLLVYRPDLLILTGNQNFWWVLSPARWMGAKVIISYHAVVWPVFSRPSRVWMAMVGLNRILIIRHAKAILETSRYIRGQIVEMLSRYTDTPPILAHLPTYSPAQFAGIRQADFPERGPFRVFFLGRIEANKGVYDIVEIARRLNELRSGQYHFDICGSGGELSALRQKVVELNLEDSVTVHGFTSSMKVQELLSNSHACIVPTRTDYEAGFEMTCAESILAGRPLITSVVCPAIDYLRPAIVEAAPDDIGDYMTAVTKLSSDREIYEEKRDACQPLQSQFYDRANSWYAKMRIAVEMSGAA